MSYDNTFGYSAIRGKLWSAFQACVEKIQKGDRVILFTKDYVMISRNVYDEMIKENYPEHFESRYYEDYSEGWLRDRFLKPKDDST